MTFNPCPVGGGTILIYITSYPLATCTHNPPIHEADPRPDVLLASKN